MKQNEPYAKLKQWEHIVEFLLLMLTFIGILALITLKLGGDIKMWVDILINVGCSLITSISLSIFIYFKFLKSIPIENKKKIEELLNARLGHEASNHNAVLNSLNPDNRQLSSEHKDITKDLQELETIEAVKKEQYSRLSSEQRVIVDSIKNLEGFTEILSKQNLEIQRLKNENMQLRTQLQQQNKYQKYRSQDNEYEYK